MPMPVKARKRIASNARRSCRRSPGDLSTTALHARVRVDEVTPSARVPVNRPVIAVLRFDHSTIAGHQNRAAVLSGILWQGCGQRFAQRGQHEAKLRDQRRGGAKPLLQPVCHIREQPAQPDALPVFRLQRDHAQATAIETQSFQQTGDARIVQKRDGHGKDPAFGRDGKAKGVDAAAGHDDAGRCRDLARRTIAGDIDGSGFDHQHLRHAGMAVRRDGPIVQAGAISDPLDMDKLRTDGAAILAIEREPLHFLAAHDRPLLSPRWPECAKSARNCRKAAWRRRSARGMMRASATRHERSCRERIAR